MRQLTEAMRAATAQPPPTSISIDQLLVREQRRKVRLRLLAAAGAVVAAAGAVPVVAAVAGPGGQPAAPPLTVPHGSAPPDEPGLSELPELQDWTGAAAGAAAGALPAGYRISGEPTEYWAAEFMLMWAEIAHPDGGRSQLLIYLDRTSEVDPPDTLGEVCDRPHPGTRFSGEEVACRPIQVAGVPLRVSTSQDQLPGSADPDWFQFTLVSHYRDGSAVHLWELPYPHPMHADEAAPELVAGPVLTTSQLARLALHPALTAP